MTNQTIPPCPVCETVPKQYPVSQHLLVKCCGRSGNSGAAIYPPELWIEYCDRELGRALRTHGIHTIPQLTERLAPDPRVAVLEKNLAKLTDKLAMVEQESEQRLSAIISYSDQLLAMKEKYEPASQSEPHPDGCFSSYMNDVQDCETDGHYSCKDCKRNSRIAAQRGEG